MDNILVFWIIMGISIFGIISALIYARWVLAKDVGTEAMRVISNAIKEGAEAFLKRQYKTIALISIGFAFLIFILYATSERGVTYALNVSIGFLFGALCSGLAGFIGMYVSIRSNIRTASAVRTSLNMALKIALRGGAVSGISVVAVSLLGVGALFMAFGGISSLNEKNLIAAVDHAEEIILQIVGFGFGASFVALFAQLGGGIYTKAADVGADIVGKVEKNIPEDDPRNPAVIADLVGDNVGDCAGRGADLFESTAAENIGAMILGATMLKIFLDLPPTIAKSIGFELTIGVVLFPLLARAFGIIASVIGVWVVRTKEDKDPMKALNVGYYVTTILAIVGFFVAVQMLLGGKIEFFICGVIGIMMAFIFVYITQYYTEYKYRPVQEIANACKTGPATTIIQGFAIGLECTALPVLTMAAAVIASYYLGQSAFTSSLQVGPDMTAEMIQSIGSKGGLFGTAVATMGMLATAGYILAMDTFGPITDNAGGIIEMSKAPAEIREKTDRLDAVGNTTKALTKGYAIGSAALAAFLLFSAYMDEISIIISQDKQKAALVEVLNTGALPTKKLSKAGQDELNVLITANKADWEALLAKKASINKALEQKVPMTTLTKENPVIRKVLKPYSYEFKIVDIAKPEVFIGGLIGAALVFLFSALAIKAVGKAAHMIIEEVRRQFREDKGIMEGTSKPNYGRCVDIVTIGALKKMVAPGLLAVLVPIGTGVLFKYIGKMMNVDGPIGAEVVAALLMVGTIGGILLALLMNNGGGAWDNAKKFIEMGNYGGKGSESHAAAVVGDTVGDPFKDTAGPSIHVLIKLLSTVTLVLAPLFV